MSILGDDIRELAKLVDMDDGLIGAAFVIIHNDGHFLTLSGTTSSDEKAKQGLAYGLYRSTISDDGNPMQTIN